MSTEPTPNRRLDGPIRRPTLRSSAPTPDVQPVTDEPVYVAPVAAAVAVEEEKVFEYHKPKRRLHWPRFRKRYLFIPLVLILGTGGWFGYATLTAVHHIIGKAGAGAPALANKTVAVSQLKGEGDGRVNILVMGIGGAGHDGANLSDTIMIWSIDPETKNVAVLSVPRDLYVKIPGHGYGKINAANSYGGPALAEQVIENVIGVPIHYYMTIDFSGFKQAVDAEGGVDINVTKALYDPYYPCDDGTKLAGKYCPINFKVGLTHMTGVTALEYARSRETTSDFDRAARQQQVIIAIRQKALDASTLTNPIKLTGLINAIGTHVHTDLQLSDMEKLASIAKDVDTTKITQKVLDTSPGSVLVDGTGTIDGAGSIELPAAGTFDYSDIHDLVKNIFVDHYITDENARIDVQNGSGIQGLAGKVVTSLTAAHYNVGTPTNAATIYPHTVIYDYTGGKKPYTINYLEERYGVKAQQMTAPTPIAGVTTPEIRIILGSDYEQSSATSSN